MDRRCVALARRLRVFLLSWRSHRGIRSSRLCDSRRKSHRGLAVPKARLSSRLEDTLKLVRQAPLFYSYPRFNPKIRSSHAKTESPRFDPRIPRLHLSSGMASPSRDLVFLAAAGGDFVS